jgi:hypothetical protein
MRSELEPQDIERIAAIVIEKLLPVIRNQQSLGKIRVADEQHTAQNNRHNKREVKPRMLTVRESARYLGVAEKTMRNRLGPRAKNPFPIKAKHIGGKVLFDVKDLDTYLDQLPTR